MGEVVDPGFLAPRAGVDGHPPRHRRAKLSASRSIGAGAEKGAIHLEAQGVIVEGTPDGEREARLPQSPADLR